MKKIKFDKKKAGKVAKNVWNGLVIGADAIYILTAGSMAGRALKKMVR